jgi:hypothetical protein
MTAQKPIAEHRLLLVTFQLHERQIDVNWWTPHFNQATDWYRYAPGSWLLWTSGTPTTWATYLHQRMTDNDFLVVVEVSGDFAGFIPQGAWDWLAKYMRTPFVDLPSKPS